LAFSAILNAVGVAEDGSGQSLAEVDVETGKAAIRLKEAETGDGLVDATDNLATGLNGRQGALTLFHGRFLSGLGSGLLSSGRGRGGSSSLGGSRSFLGAATGSQSQSCKKHNQEHYEKFTGH
jgi:hypothetical protein